MAFFLPVFAQILHKLLALSELAVIFTVFSTKWFPGPNLPGVCYLCFVSVSVLEDNSSQYLSHTL
jgi:hypothetical protein